MSDEESTGPGLPDAAAMPEVTSLAEAADQVSSQAGAVAEQIARLRTELHDARAKAEADVAAAKKKAAEEVAVERRDRRRATWKFALVVMIDVVLSAMSLGLYVDQRATEAKLHQTQVAVLCPLYRLFAQAIELPRAGETDQQRAIRLAAAKPIREGYTTLGCQPPLKSG